MASQRVSAYRAIVREVNRAVSEALVSHEGGRLILVGSLSMLALRDQKLSRNMCEPSLIPTEKIRARIYSTTTCAMQQRSCTHSGYTRCHNLSSCFHDAGAYLVLTILARMRTHRSF